MAEQTEERVMPSNLRRVLVVIALMCPGSGVLADVITDWDQKAIDIVAPRMPSPQAQRIVATMHPAMFDALNSIERRYQPYLAQLPASPTTSKYPAWGVSPRTEWAKSHPNPA